MFPMDLLELMCRGGGAPVSVVFQALLVRRALYVLFPVTFLFFKVFWRLD